MSEKIPQFEAHPQENLESREAHQVTPEVLDVLPDAEAMERKDAEKLEQVREVLEEQNEVEKPDKEDTPSDSISTPVVVPQPLASSLSHFAHRIQPRLVSLAERKMGEVLENRDGKMQCRTIELNSTKPVSVGAIGCVHGNVERFDEAVTDLTKSENPVDVLCLLGDFFKNKKSGPDEPDDTDQIIARIAKAKADRPEMHIVAILGNNDVFYHHQSDTASGDGKSVSDWRNNQSILEERLSAAGVEILKDRTITLEIEKNGQTIPYTIYGAPELELIPPYGDPKPWVDPVPEKSGVAKLMNTVLRRANTSVGDTESGRNKPGKSWKDAISAREAGMLLQGPTEKPDLILAHNPDSAYMHHIEDHKEVDVFSSHTHGFQNLAVLPIQSLIRLGATRYGTSEWVGYGAGSYDKRPDGEPCNVHITAGLVGKRIPYISQRPDYMRAEPKKG